MSAPFPIEQVKEELLDSLKTHGLTILSAEPGAGKSTRLPLWLLESNSPVEGTIYLLQPRRVAVKNIATFLAKQLSEQVGQRVGYQMRHDTKSDKRD